MLLATLTAKEPPTKALPAPAAKRLRGWPRGRPRGPRKPADKAARLVAQRRRDAEKKREQRAAARAAQAKPNGSNGRDSPEITSAQALWQHAEKLQPKGAIGREFGINEAVARDAHRTHKLPSQPSPVSGPTGELKKRPMRPATEQGIGRPTDTTASKHTTTDR
jgi:hypothetical protein